MTTETQTTNEKALKALALEMLNDGDVFDLLRMVQDAVFEFNFDNQHKGLKEGYHKITKDLNAAIATATEYGMI